MKKISEIDKNFSIEITKKENMRVYNVQEAPFKVYGVFKQNSETGYVRMPTEIAEGVNEGVAALNFNTSGGRIRFKTDSKYIALKYVLPRIDMMMHMPLTGSAGFDLYADGEYVKTLMGFDFIERIKTEGKVVYESEVVFNQNKMRDIVINFPLYNAVDDVYIGLEETAKIEEGNPYKGEKPVVLYGSSITQGGCVSRPGNAYPNVLSRKFDFDFINLGFSGSAMGEKAIAEYIAGLDMRMFIYDYDHNAPDLKHLENTHYAMYKIIRDAKPDIPIVMASRPNRCGDDTNERFEVIKASFERAKAEGDRNVFLIDGTDIFNSHDRNMMTVDGCHPNDFGSFCMAEKFEEVIKNIN